MNRKKTKSHETHAERLVFTLGELKKESPEAEKEISKTISLLENYVAEVRSKDLNTKDVKL